MTRSWVEKPAVTTISPSSRTVSPMRSLRASAWVSGRLSRGRPSTGALLKAGHRAVFENAQRGAPVDPAVEADRDGHETVAVGIVDVDGKRGGVAAGAHRAEAGRVDGFEQVGLHVADHRVLVHGADAGQRGALRQLGGMVEGAADAHADDDGRAVLGARFQHALHEIFLDLGDLRIGEYLEGGPAAGAERLGLAGDLHVAGAVDDIEGEDRHVPSLVAALQRQRMGDELQDRRLDRLHEVGEAVDEGTADVAVERQPRADPDEIGREAGVRTGVAVFALGGKGRRLHEVERALRDGAGLALARLAKRLQRVVGYLLQRPAVEVARRLADDIVGDRQCFSPGLRKQDKSAGKAARRKPAWRIFRRAEFTGGRVLTGGSPVLYCRAAGAR